MSQRAHVKPEAPTLRAKSVGAGSFDAGERADFDAEAAAVFVAGAISHDVVGEWLLRLAKGGRTLRRATLQANFNHSQNPTPLHQAADKSDAKAFTAMSDQG